MFWQMTSDPPQDREDDGTEELPLPTLELETAALDALAKELLWPDVALDVEPVAALLVPLDELAAEVAALLPTDVLPADEEPTDEDVEGPLLEARELPRDDPLLRPEDGTELVEDMAKEVPTDAPPDEDVLLLGTPVVQTLSVPQVASPGQSLSSSQRTSLHAGSCATQRSASAASWNGAFCSRMRSMLAAGGSTLHGCGGSSVKALTFVTLLAWLAPGGAPLAAAPGPSVAIMPLEAKAGMASDVAELMGDRLSSALLSRKVFDRVVTNKELETALSLEARKQLLSCANDSCAAEVAAALAVSHVLMGNIGKIGGARVLNLRLVDVKKIRQLASVSQKVTGDDEALFDVIQPAVDRLLADAGLAPMTGTAADAPPAAAGPETGTAAPVPATTPEAARPESSTEKGATSAPATTPVMRYALWGCAGVLGALSALLVIPLLGALAGTAVMGLSFFGQDALSIAVRKPTTFETRAAGALGAGAGAGFAVLLLLVGLAGVVGLAVGGFVAG